MQRAVPKRARASRGTGRGLGFCGRQKDLARVDVGAAVGAIVGNAIAGRKSAFSPKGRRTLMMTHYVSRYVFHDAYFQLNIRTLPNTFPQ